MILTLQLIYLLVPITFAFTFVAHFAFCIHRIQAERSELSNIPYMKKKELIQLARKHLIKYSGLNKYALQNVLIYELA